MYVMYDSHQTSFKRPQETSWRNIGIFRPAWVVRVSDMTIVPGTTATYGYHAFSYSWNYSGDIIKSDDGKAICEDKGLHEVITHSWNSLRQFHTVTTTTTTTVTLVKFEAVIQQICKDFGIDYIWYDKLCIDQEDKAERIAEIKKMHKIYKNALFTVVLMPELAPEISAKGISKSRLQKDPFDGYCLEAIIKSEWCTRMWTLEEAILSRDLVFIGERAHFWSHQVPGDLFYYGKSEAHRICHPIVHELCTDNRADASKVLHFAHRRTSTKELDKVFALANVFSDTLPDMNVDYKRQLADALREFYGRLVQKDITVLFFGKPLNDYPSTMRQLGYLPSWTGIAGMHILQLGLEYRQRTNNYFDSISNAGTEVEEDYSISVSGTNLIIKCNAIMVKPELITERLDNDDDYKTNAASVNYLELFYNLKVSHYSSKVKKHQENNYSKIRRKSNGEEEFKSILPQQQVYHSTAFMSLTEDCHIKEGCHVLDIPFNMYKRHGIFHPVIRWDQDLNSYKAIGVFIIHIFKPLQSISVPLDRFGTLKHNKFNIQ